MFRLGSNYICTQMYSIIYMVCMNLCVISPGLANGRGRGGKLCATNDMYSIVLQCAYTSNASNVQVDKSAHFVGGRFT